MNVDMITCSMCGHTFNPANHVACQACPLQKGCSLVCCPVCGFEMVDVQKSALAKWAARWFFSGRTHSAQPTNPLSARPSEDHNHDIA